MGELERHDFFGGSPAAFAMLREQSPPSLAVAGRHRRARGASGDCSSSGNSEGPRCCGAVDIELAISDSDSSAECTPEIGQAFAAPAVKHASPDAVELQSFGGVLAWAADGGAASAAAS